MVPVKVTTQLHMVADILAGAITFGVTEAQNAFDPGTRRAFLMTPGKSFCSARRAQRLFKHQKSAAAMGVPGAMSAAVSSSGGTGSGTPNIVAGTVGKGKDM